ncbi:hypothetical protein 4 [Hubei picorna-like virus 71]|uniref:hypothetical protein 4 n=1 Tax=Hubei picorna-like virus 71 TaxID=1923155 RepID=UPI00090A34FA|nr:hypothetical protein 4 [Hubei picorna-like virus 71]APG77434.1 hypothetical protein 4 [Hubei picorna-like virus 71]
MASACKNCSPICQGVRNCVTTTIESLRTNLTALSFVSPTSMQAITALRDSLLVAKGCIESSDYGRARFVLTAGTPTAKELSGLPSNTPFIRALAVAIGRSYSAIQTNAIDTLQKICPNEQHHHIMYQPNDDPLSCTPWKFRRLIQAGTVDRATADVFEGFENIFLLHEDPGYEGHHNITDTLRTCHGTHDRCLYCVLGYKHCYASRSHFVRVCGNDECAGCYFIEHHVLGRDVNHTRMIQFYKFAQMYHFYANRHYQIDEDKMPIPEVNTYSYPLFTYRHTRTLYTTESQDRMIENAMNEDGEIEWHRLAESI